MTSPGLPFPSYSYCLFINFDINFCEFSTKRQIQKIFIPTPICCLFVLISFFVCLNNFFFKITLEIKSRKIPKEKPSCYPREISIKGKVYYRLCSWQSTLGLSVGKEEIQSYVFQNYLLKSWLTTEQAIVHFPPVYRF